MFTGLVKFYSRVLDKQKVEGGFTLSIARPQDFDDLQVGESIAVDGICLTLESFDEEALNFFVGLETLAKTSFLAWRIGKTLNVERSLTMGDRLGGHIVTGHIDGTALVSEIEHVGKCMNVKINLSEKLAHWVIPKGSICVNGVSLTVNEWSPQTGVAELFLIPETLKMTNLDRLETGEFVNVECDSFVKVLVEKMASLKEHRELNV